MEQLAKVKKTVHRVAEMMRAISQQYYSTVALRGSTPPHEVEHPAVVWVFSASSDRPRDERVSIVNLDPEFFSSALAKDLLAQRMKKLLAGDGVRFIVLVCEAWAVQKTVQKDANGVVDLASVMKGSLEDDPAKTEALIMSFSFRNGAKANVSHRIVREAEKRPMLQPNPQMLFDTEGDASVLSGRFMVDGDQQPPQPMH